MDIAALSISMSGAKVSQGVNIALLNKAKEQMEQTGEQIVEMIQSSAVKPSSGIDIRL